MTKFVNKHAEWWGGGEQSMADLKKKVREEPNATRVDQQGENNDAEEGYRVGGHQPHLFV